METLNVRQEISAVSLDTVYLGFQYSLAPRLALQSLSQWHPRPTLSPALLTSSNLVDLMGNVALNGILTSPLLVKAGVSPRQCWGPILNLIFINDLSDSGKSSLSIF